MTRYRPRRKSDMACPLNEKDAILLAIWRTMCNTPKEWVVVLIPGENQCKFLSNTRQSSFFFRTRYCDPTVEIDHEAAKLIFLGYRHSTRRHFDPSRAIPRDCKNPLKVYAAQAVVRRRRQEKPESGKDDSTEMGGGGIMTISSLSKSGALSQRTSLRLAMRRSSEDAVHAPSPGCKKGKATKASSIKVIIGCIY